MFEGWRSDRMRQMVASGPVCHSLDDSPHLQGPSRLDQYEMNRTNSLGRGGRERSDETLNVSREFQRVIERPGHA